MKLIVAADPNQTVLAALEEEVDYISLAMRFPDEEPDPIIMFLIASLSDLENPDFSNGPKKTERCRISSRNYA